LYGSWFWLSLLLEIAKDNQDGENESHLPSIYRSYHSEISASLAER
jgi:hypothetical protein